MSTRCLIGTQYGASIKAIYCHNDGYLSNVGELLKNNYNTDFLVKDMLDLGDLSVLGKYLTIPEDRFPKKKLYLPNIDCLADISCGGYVSFPYNVQIWHKHVQDEMPKIEGIYTYAGDGTFAPNVNKIQEYLIRRNENETTPEIENYIYELKKCLTDVTVAYHRDMEEELHYYNYGSLKDYIECDTAAEFKYLWQNNEWLYCDSTEETFRRY